MKDPSIKILMFYRNIYFLRSETAWNSTTSDWRYEHFQKQKEIFIAVSPMAITSYHLDTIHALANASLRVMTVYRDPYGPTEDTKQVYDDMKNFGKVEGFMVYSVYRSAKLWVSRYDWDFLSRLESK